MGRNKGICQLITALQKFSITQENVLQTLQEKYDLSEERGRRIYEEILVNSGFVGMTWQRSDARKRSQPLQ